MSAALAATSHVADPALAAALLDASGVIVEAYRSPQTQRAYRRALRDFLLWYERQGFPRLSRRVVTAYIQHLRESSTTASSINQRLAPIHRLAKELALAGHLTDAEAVGIQLIGCERQEGVRSGNWLTREEAQALLNTPDIASRKGVRDRALLAVFLGAGLRREEVSNLTFRHVQQREGRWVIVDIAGKRGKVRSVPIPAWVKVALDAWRAAAEVSPEDAGYVFRALRRGGRLDGDSLSAQAIRDAHRAARSAAHLGQARAPGRRGPPADSAESRTRVRRDHETLSRRGAKLYGRASGSLRTRARHLSDVRSHR